MSKLNIAIDGPAGAGKSTIAKKVAARLGLIYIDTGAMYRALTWQALQQGIDFSDEAKLSSLAEATDVTLQRTPDGQLLVYCNKQDVTSEIRTPEVSANVAKLASYPTVRRRLVELQQKLAAHGGVIMDGRDIASTVLPNADHKFFLTASLAERAKRRWLELQQSGYKVEYKQLESEMAARDHQDENRSIAPLKVVDDANLIDTDQLDIHQVVDKIIAICGGETAQK